MEARPKEPRVQGPLERLAKIGAIVGVRVQTKKLPEPIGGRWFKEHFYGTITPGFEGELVKYFCIRFDCGSTSGMSAEELDIYLELA